MEYDRTASQERAAGRTAATQQQGNVASLRKEFHESPEVVTWKKVLPKANAFYAALSRPGPQAELYATYALTYLLDELGSVRESDIQSITGASNWQDTIGSLQSRIAGNGSMGAEQRQKLKAIVDSRIGEYQKGYELRKNLVGRVAKEYQYNPDLIFGEQGEANQQPVYGAQQQPTAPQTGGMAAPQGGEHPAVARARALIATHPEARSKVIMSLQRSGIDTSGL
jgi:hypothetical protein